MRVFVAGAAGAIGRQLVPMLIEAGHVVTGTTRSAERAAWLRSQGAQAVVVDVLDADALRAAVVDAGPHVVVHQLTDLAAGFGVEQLRANARLRQVGTRNLMDATLARGVPNGCPKWRVAVRPGPRTARRARPAPRPGGRPRSRRAARHHRTRTDRHVDTRRRRPGACATASSTARARIARIPGTTLPSMSSRPRTRLCERSTADRPGSTTSSTMAARSATAALARNWAGSPGEAAGRPAEKRAPPPATEGP